MRLREIGIGAGLGAVLAGVVAITVPAPEPAPVATAAAAKPVVLPAAARAPQTVSAPPAPSAARAPAQAQASWRDMHAKFVRAPSLRVFFYDAMRHPGDGDYYYASNLLQTCKLALKAGPNLPSAQRAAADRLRQRCDFTPQGLEDAERELHAARHLDLGKDALLGSMFDYLAADGVDGRAAMLRAAFEQGNPEVIGSLVAHALESKLPPPAPGELDSTARGIPYGAVLVACRLGADCGPVSLRTLELCMQQGWCADSVPAALEQGLGPHFAALDRIAAYAVRDVRRGDPNRMLATD